jgi:xanthine/CO dehydrogenase XdhC/CoxF family maturation factor
VRDLLDDIDRWRRQGKRVAIARVVDIDGSAPREPGAAMAVSEDGEVAGSVSGGCVEGALVEAALTVLATGERGVRSFSSSGSVGSANSFGSPGSNNSVVSSHSSDSSGSASSISSVGSSGSSNSSSSASSVGSSGDDPFAVGLTCGGTLHVFIEPLDW